jgi:hypothetical protein
MFTFGRQHEKKCAVSYVRDIGQASLIHDVIDAVHDVLENQTDIEDVRPVFSRAFTEGGSGVWEQTGSWIWKLAVEYPDLDSLWQEFATNTDWKVRFRAACFINNMPVTTATEIGNILRNDRSKRVREMAQARLEEMSS